MLPQPDQATERLQQLQAKLNLSDTQTAQVGAIDSVYRQNLLQLKNEGGSRLSKLRAFRELSSDKDQQIKAVLSAQQYQQYQALKSQMKADFKQHRSSNAQNDRS